MDLRTHIIVAILHYIGVDLTDISPERAVTEMA